MGGGFLFGGSVSTIVPGRFSIPRIREFRTMPVQNKNTIEKFWSFYGHNIGLELWPGKVFIPTTTSELIARQFQGCAGETVVDLGCGSGFFAILAAKIGAKKVYALDLLEDACELTRLNAKKNAVSDKVDCRQGDLFAPLNGVVADTIINDVSGITESLARFSGWFPAPIPTGGKDGSEAAVRMFKTVPGYLAPKGRLIFPVLSLSNEKRILEAAHQAFGDVRLVINKWFPLPPALIQPESPFHDLLSTGAIRAVKKGSRWLWELRIYEARRPLSS